MILAHQEGVPLDQVTNNSALSLLLSLSLLYYPCSTIFLKVVPVLLENLPLKEDMEEVGTVYTCFLKLFSPDSDNLVVVSLPYSSSNSLSLSSLCLLLYR